MHIVDLLDVLLAANSSVDANLLLHFLSLRLRISCLLLLSPRLFLSLSLSLILLLLLFLGLALCASLTAENYLVRLLLKPVI